ncbi:metal ABC transporter solute-binding protein, Zn/Mn family [Pseudochryseolinea flava]|uniref:Manganese transporter n=1 Tax=Pseudochryseolinea flava TaxID=2059302 RepID=A0A364XYP8_9BACT|nr:zinc ABC transporter substrate-binding protein [Pseudochryseolinea flava]RAV99629.1 manganese transporter [Pseudochryseolinea flava]
MSNRFQQSKRQTLITHFLWLSLLVVIAGCKGKETPTTQGRLQVVTTTGMIKDAVTNIAGDRVDVVALMGPGVDPHLYKATQGDLAKLTAADIIFYNGLHLEGKMGEVFEKLTVQKTVVPVSVSIEDTLLRAVPGFQGTHDPHIWFDVKLWENAVKQVSKTLQEKDSVNAAYYMVNEKKYLATLDSLDDAVRKHLQEVSKEQRVLITAHDAFGYYGDAYQVEVRGLQGISTMSEFGLKDVTELVNFIIGRKIKAIFVETSVSQKSIEAVVEGCKQKGWDVKIGGSLYSDAMGEEGTPDGTYVGMVSANTRTIVRALK